MSRFALLLVIALGAGSAVAQQPYGYSQSRPSSGLYGGSTYDGRSQNSYNSSGSGGYRGYNAGTGSTWGAQTYGGRTTGTDAGGNAWSYDRSTGIYQNYGTGETRSRGRAW